MEYIKDTTTFHIEEPCAISLGKFDGLHRGHELLMEYMFEQKKKKLKTAVFTFNIPPKPGVCEEDLRVLTTNEEKLHIFRRIGLDYLIECPFTQEIRSMEAEDFIRKIVRELNVRYMVVGTDFCFGHNRRGNYKMLLEYADKLGYELQVVDKIQFEHRDISSTFVREEIVAGNIERANQLLGYKFFVQGEVVHGRHMGGEVLGIPTINLVPPANKLLPPYGVYVAEITVDGEYLQGIANVGCKPTIEGENPVGVETHIFDLNRNLYGKKVRVKFIKRVRQERKFDSLEALKEQMNRDIFTGRQYFEQNVNNG